MPVILAFYKPFGVLSQFTQEHPSHRVLAEFGFPPRTYAIGRLDRDSEGLLLLSDEAQWNDRLLNPRHVHPRTYHARHGAILLPWRAAATAAHRASEVRIGQRVGVSE